jgi:hypothetical protein
MWIMTPDGILMPAAVPAANGPWNANGYDWDQQVRARDKRVLTKLRKRMLAEHMVVSDIVATPQLDYDYRMYVLAVDFGYIVNLMITEIDYEKFKPVSLLKGRGGKKLHDVYNRIWGIVADAYDSPILYRYNPRRGQR